LHYLLPFIIAGASILHIAALHQYGSNNPLGCLATVDKVSFYPYFFFKDLVGYMTSGPIIAAILEKENAVNDFRELIGSTNPEEAKEGTIRNMFAKSISENAIHGSDSDENAKIECEFHFSPDEIF